ncbi:MAG: glycosyltransferase [Phycisphaerales bacterium]
MPLTILHISTRLILGGSQENTVLSCEGQAELGHDVHLTFGPIFGPEGSLLERAEGFRTKDDRPIHCHEVPNLVREISPSADRRCLYELMELMERINPDVVHTHSSKAGVLGRIAAWKRFKSSTNGRPAVIHTIHGPPFMPIEGGALSRSKVAFKNWMYTVAERTAARSCHTIVSVADAMTDQFRERSIGTMNQYVTVRSGMEVEKFLKPLPDEDRASMRAQLGFSDDDFVIGTVARLAQHKGHDDILDGLCDDLRANPRWKLLWVGDGWWTDRLIDRVRELGFEDQLVHTGLVPQHRVGAMMRAMDVLLHPSYREGLPRTVPQALLCSVPVCASNTDGTPEICVDARTDPNNATGLLFEPGDAHGLGDSIRWMYEHPHERRKLGVRGREICTDMFSTERMVSELERVYAAALARSF